MPLHKSKYSIELWDKSGVRTAILSGLADERTIAESRNEAEDIQWSIPTPLLKRYARDNHRNPETLIIPRVTEVRIKRGDIYLAGGEVMDAPDRLTADGWVIKVVAQGYLNFFKDRFTAQSHIFTQQAYGTIAEQLVKIYQGNEPDVLTLDDTWDFGVTVDEGDWSSAIPHDVTYKRTNIKDALQALTRRKTDAIDFTFSADKVFKVHQPLGSKRPKMIFRYPGNILPGSEMAYLGRELANQILVFGSGISEEAAPPVVRPDDRSQLTYKVRQAKITPNDVSEQDTLEEHGDAELAARSVPLDIPVLKVDGSHRPFVTDYRVGDWVKVILRNGPLRERSAMMRVERREISIDKDDKEDVALYVSL